MKLIKQYFLYLIRWQLSTPILAFVIYAFHPQKIEWVPSIIANFIGGLVFFWVDKFIFKEKKEKSNEK